MLNDQIKDLQKEIDLLRKSNKGSSEGDEEKLKELQRELEKELKKNDNLEK